MPRHKAKVEAGVKYVQANGLAGQQFTSLGGQNFYLAQWEKTVADTRIHGPTRQQVDAHFRTVEQATLQPLPAGLFPVFSEAPRKVHRDGYVEVDKSYYSVPPEYVRRSVWARWDAKMVRLFNDHMAPIAVHVRQEPGKFCTDPGPISTTTSAPSLHAAPSGFWTVVGSWGRRRALGPRRFTSSAAPSACGSSRGSWRWPRSIRPASSIKPANWP